MRSDLSARQLKRGWFLGRNWASWGTALLLLSAGPAWAQEEGSEPKKESTTSEEPAKDKSKDKPKDPSTEPVTTAPGTEAELAEKYPELRDAIESLKQFKFDDCLKKLEEASAKYPELPPGRLIYAELLVKANQLGAAQQEFERVVDEKPDDPRTYLSMGAIGMAQGRRTDALFQFNHAIGLADKFDFKEADGREKFLGKCFLGRATLYEAKKDWKGALADIEKWIASDPKNGAARQRLARCHFFIGDLAKAEEELKQAKADGPTLSPPDTALATFYAANEEHDKAEEHFRKGVEAEQNNPLVYQSFAQWLFTRNRVAEAKEQAVKGLQTLPDSRDLRTLRAKLARHLKSYEEAEAELEDLLKDSPNNLDLRNELALALAEQQDGTKQKRAFQIAQENFNFNRNSADLCATFGWVNYRLGQMDNAEKLINTAARMVGTQARPDILYYLAHILAEKGQNEDVKKLLAQISGSTLPFAFKDDASQWLERLNTSGGDK
ncbi:tetratricopeptide repeat protein [bacterium]|jgi:tetratricopeptide (TPR) repeat protein|nr:tetratricopeptide repeat protein [bacterium]